MEIFRFLRRVNACVLALGVFGLAGCDNNDRKVTVTSNTTNDTLNTLPKTDPDTTAVVTKKAVKKGKVSGDLKLEKKEKDSVVEVIRDKDGIYTSPEIMPQFPGGEKELAKYLANNIDYEEEALDADVTGTVQVSFVVDEQGKVRDARVISRKVGGGLDEQAVTAVEAMPAWTPGTVKNKKVKTRLTLPINFRIE